MTTFITERDPIKFHSPTAYQQANDMIRFYRAKAEAEEAWKVRDDELEAMMSNGCIDYSRMAHLERVAVRWERAADKLYDEIGECDCKPDAPVICRACKATISNMYDDEIPFEFGAEEPPDDPRIFNRKQEDGTYRPLSEYFDRGKS